MSKMSVKVSVCMITYNHEDFIEEAIHSVLSQETPFDIELIIGNDFSSDRTHDIIESIINTHPKGHLINYYNHEKNLGIANNFLFILNQAKGAYIAILEGDDYWLDSLKLQKQVSFLDTHPDYNLISNEVKEYDQSTKKFIKRTILENSYTVNYKNLLEKSHTHTCTLMIRNRIPKELPRLFFKEVGSDRSLCLLTLGLNGKGYISKDVVAVYRIHDQSISRIGGNKSTLKNLNYLMAHIRIAQDWNKFYGGTCNKIVWKVKKKRLKQMMNLILKRRSFKHLYMIYKGLLYN